VAGGPRAQHAPRTGGNGSSERAEDFESAFAGGLRALQEADDRLKGGKDARTVLEFLVSELTAAEAQAARG